MNPFFAVVSPGREASFLSLFQTSAPSFPPFRSVSLLEVTELLKSVPQPTQFNKYYRKHQKCLKLNGLQPKTIEAYSRAMRRIGNYFDCRIDNLISDQLLDYFNELLDSHSWNTVKLDLYGLKFFYTKVLNKTWDDIPLIKPPKTIRIPDILSIEQVNRLFAATNKLSYKVFFFRISNFSSIITM